MTERVVYVSPSKLKAVRACPRRCFEEPYTESEATKFGSALHVGAAALSSGKTLDAACVAYDTAISKIDPAMVTPENAERALNALHAILDNRRLAFDPKNVIEVESENAKTGFTDGTKKFYEVSITKTWGLRVMIDVVATRPETGALHIVDWKSGKSEEDDDVQNACYALAASRLYPGFNEIEAGYFYTEQGKDGWYDPTTWNADSLKAAEEYIGGLVREYIEEKAAKKHVERMNKKCGWCALKTNCATYQERTQVIPQSSAWNVEATVENFPTIIGYLEQITAICSAAEAIKEELTERRNEVMKNNPVIYIGGQTFTRTRKVNRYNYHAKELFDETARLIGRAPMECVTWDNKTADELMKKTFPKRGDKTRKEWEEFVKGNRTVKSESYGVKVTLSKEVPAQIEAPEQEE